MEIYSEFNTIEKAQFQIISDELDSLNARLDKLTEWLIEIEKRIGGNI